MNRNELLEALGEVDACYIEEAERNYRTKRILSLVIPLGVLVLLIAAFFVYLRVAPAEKPGFTCQENFRYRLYDKDCIVVVAEPVDPSDFELVNLGADPMSNGILETCSAHATWRVTEVLSKNAELEETEIAVLEPLGKVEAGKPYSKDSFAPPLCSHEGTVVLKLVKESRPGLYSLLEDRHCGALWLNPDGTLEMTVGDEAPAVATLDELRQKFDHRK